jgi:plastocyanin
MNSRTVKYLALAAGFALAVNCGGSSTSPSPNPNPGGGGSAGPIGATITIGANGVLSPSSVTISSGQSVMFVNNHNRDHQIASDPHPNHTDCPAINALNTLGAGQSRATNALSTTRTCGVHDHLEDTNTNLQGRIIVQ